MTTPLAALAVLLGFAAAWEIVGGREEEARRHLAAGLGALTAGRARSLAEAALRLGVPGRLQRAGLTGRFPASAVVAVKLAGAVAGLGVGLIAAPALPGRLAPGVPGLLGASGFLAPDALLEREARLRRGRLVTALPDALDLLAVGAASGRGLTTVLAEIAGGTIGPLATELGIVVADVEGGVPVREAVESLRRRLGGAEVGALASALERSRRYGSPLAGQLHEQATGLRRDARRRIEEHASRAAPKIQLVVALVLVPSVLLMILAAILAHSDALFGAI
jgi:tight adherence protein C